MGLCIRIIRLTLIQERLIVTITNGQKASEEFYVDGKKQGKSRGWYENGQLKLEVHYVDGKEQGRAITWDENGQETLEINYVDGKVVQETDP